MRILFDTPEKDPIISYFLDLILYILWKDELEQIKKRIGEINVSEWSICPKRAYARLCGYYDARPPSFDMLWGKHRLGTAIHNYLEMLLHKAVETLKTDTSAYALKLKKKYDGFSFTTEESVRKDLSYRGSVDIIVTVNKKARVYWPKITLGRAVADFKSTSVKKLAKEAEVDEGLYKNDSIPDIIAYQRQITIYAFFAGALAQNKENTPLYLFYLPTDFKGTEPMLGLQKLKPDVVAKTIPQIMKEYQLINDSMVANLRPEDFPLPRSKDIEAWQCQYCWYKPCPKNTNPTAKIGKIKLDIEEVPL